ncbi:MAG: GTP-binding protein [Coriobacteriia bacterium]|nr:GTP-binding protein [Coriobacteriia bacterium]
MHSLKVVIVGPAGSGKTTFIGAVSEITVLSTRREIGAGGKDAADRIAVDMDFGRVTLADDIVLYLFGTPGHERVSFMWETLSEGLLGFVVLLDSENSASLEEARETIAFLRGDSELPFLVAANKLAPDDAAAVKHLRTSLHLPDDIPLVSVDARSRESAKLVLEGLAQEAVRRG